MEPLYDRLKNLENSLKKVFDGLYEQRQKVIDLENENDHLKLQIKQYKKQFLVLQDENESLKLANAMMGDVAHKKVLKMRINKLISSIDDCITQIRI